MLICLVVRYPNYIFFYVTQGDVLLYSFNWNNSSTEVFNNFASFMASSRVGLYLLFSIAMIVCLVTPNFSATSSCRNPSSLRNNLILFCIVYYLTLPTIWRVINNLAEKKIIFCKQKIINGINGKLPSLIKPTMHHAHSATITKTHDKRMDFKFMAISISSALVIFITIFAS